MVGVLYISYDGMLEPLGQSQVLAYLKRLAYNRPIHLISFEKPEYWLNIQKRKILSDEIAFSGIVWHPMRYHKRLTAIATLWDIVCGSLLGLFLVFRYRLRIVHARSYVASVVALLIKRITGVKYIFDMRGFWADERVEGGLWLKRGRLYQVAKWFEGQFLLKADVVVSLTHVAVHEMRSFPYLQKKMPHFEVITTCADLELFRPRQSKFLSHDHDRQFTLGYVGSVGVWYLFDETLRCFQLLRKRLPNARLLILNKGGHEFIRERMRALHIDADSVLIKETDHQGVASAMLHMDAGIFFYKPLYSKLATAPTRLGEFLGCGVPCLGNTMVGDMADIIEREQVGVALHLFDENSMVEAIDRLLQLTESEGIRQRCRHVALRYFSLDEGVRHYAAIYEKLASS